MCRKYKFKSKWYENVLESRADNNILCYFTMQADHVIQASRPYIVIMDKTKYYGYGQDVIVIDTAVLEDVDR